eukprot:CAMPEP_0172361920 /NCGR_PEP_ID=MMETSP1060-20121228/5673_1 /TAXON_ID=37318 /ORGANISM="Pseudo-nitzschia pungens, Strain cf. cingulata" /LENGTH=485 /DNA_ID=CAMNT_0013084321 /DNA_START=74 /DNA_END=1531 /DNA_ORIENTATION=-
MKVSDSFAPALCVLLASTTAVVVDAFVPSHGTTWSSTLSTSSSSSTTKLHYDIQRDPQPNDNVWAILSNTEKWIANTLAEAQSGNSNPLSRKEVSYVCETSKDPAMILANIFRKVKEARQLGETHAQDQEALVEEQGEDKHNRVTLRQTQVLVIPGNDELSENFHVFDAVIQSINDARRAARDLVTDYSLEKLDEQLYGEGDEKDWVVSVNCAHLHPKYGEKTPEQQLKELKEEEEEGEVDLNLREYKRQRILARRSPYPSVVIEVRSMAPPEFTPPPPSGPTSPRSIDDIDTSKSSSSSSSSDDAIDADFVHKLEALFSKSSLDSSSGSKKEGDFYESIGSHIETFSSVTPLMVAQNWIAENDPVFDIQKCSFTVSDATHVDEAYEFCFTNLGMQTARFLGSDDNSSSNSSQAKDAQKRQYMVMPHFLSSSATSLEKFVTQAQKIVRKLPSIGDKVELTCFHPESVNEHQRCPVPVIVLQWKGD